MLPDLASLGPIQRMTREHGKGPDVDYFLAKVVGEAFDDAVEMVTAQLQDEGFGVLT